MRNNNLPIHIITDDSELGLNKPEVIRILIADDHLVVWQGLARCLIGSRI
jgi:hypothetical protein